MKALLTTIIAGAIVALAMPAMGQYTPQSREDETLFAAGTVGGSSTVVDYRGQAVTTVITFSGISETATDGTDEGESQIIYTFPEGRILIIGAAIDANVVNTDDFEASDNDHYFVGIGSAAAGDDATLTGTEVDIIAANNIDTTAGATLTTSWEADFTAGGDIVLDGTAAAKSLYFNMCVADTQIDDDMTVTPSGVLTVTWLFLGDD